MNDRTVPHLSDVLAAGALPADNWIVEKFSDALEVLTRGRDPQRWVFLQLHGVLGDMPEELWGVAADQRSATYWAIDLVESPELVPAMWDGLDPFTAAELELLLDWSAHPYPMFVGTKGDGPESGGWSCCSCGTDKTNDDVALVIEGRTGYSDDLECPITYCRDCVQLAAAARDVQLLVCA